jgi:hypothetical protein
VRVVLTSIVLDRGELNSDAERGAPRADFSAGRGSSSRSAAPFRRAVPTIP